MPRRSARLRGESAEAPEEHVVVARRPAPPTAKKAAAFNPAAACDRLVAGDSAVRAALTKAQLAEVAETFARRERDLEERVLQLAAERDLVVEKLSRRRDLESAEREARIIERVAAIRAAETAVKAASPPAGTTTTATPPAASPAEIIAAEPTPRSPAETPAATQSWRRFAASIGGFLSPFAGRSSTPITSQAAPPAATSEEPLGELTPSARKRAAPEEETPRAARTPSAFLGPSAKNPQVPTSLSAITELTERSTSIMSASSNTPSRAPRSVRAARTARQQSTTPSTKRTWQSQAQQSTSSALLRFQRMRAAEHEAQKLRAEQEDSENSLHRRKRVKVAELITLPHHRPDESSSTFRVPDIDSDDEMEVDEDEPVRTNVFVMATTQVEEQQTPQHASTPTPKTTPRAVAVSSPFEPAACSTPEPTPRAVATSSSASQPAPEPASQYAPEPAATPSRTAAASSPALPVKSPTAWELFVEAWNKPTERPTDPAEQYYYDFFVNRMIEVGIPFKGPDERLDVSEAEADALADHYFGHVVLEPSPN